MLADNVRGYLRDRFRLADAVLFTGAGFSRGMQNIAGQPMPLGNDLKPILWHLSFPSDPFEPTSSLQDLFEYARKRARNALIDALRRNLTVAPASIPLYYERLFALPWFRAYTLNVDDAAQAVSRQFALPRQLVTSSALYRGGRPLSPDPSRALEVIHLNGVLDDAPDGVTFSTTQYAERLNGQEPLYAQCAADILAHPVVFIGTPLDESPLWQHVTLRRRGAGGGGEFRRRSFIVTPHLDRPRRELLEREFNVEHLAMTAEEFAAALTPDIVAAAAEGLALVRTPTVRSKSTQIVPLAGTLASAVGSVSTEYLLGQAPVWSDISGGRAIPREADAELKRQVDGLLGSGSGPKGVMILTGTAGSGKSTAAMRLALSLTSEGRAVGWVDNDVDISPLDIRRSMEKPGHPSLIVVDDADRYGSSVADLAAEVARGPDHPLVVLSVRSSRVDRISDRLQIQAVPRAEIVMPPLADSDIDSLLEVLDRENRLGVLKGKSHSEQVRAFRQHAGRQLLVAMLSATSGRRFEERIVNEMEGLDAEAKALYGLTAIATAIRFSLTRDELLLAVREATNATLAALDALQRRHLIVSTTKNELRVRHRVIAEVLLESMAAEGFLPDLMTRLAIAAASKVGPGTRRGSSEYRRVRSLMNHDWLSQYIGQENAKRLYAELEALMRWDYHYWLQRGSLELEAGDMQLADNFLNQSYSLEAGDPLIQTEMGYLQLKLAVKAANGDESRRLFREGTGFLTGALRSRGGSDPHQYHIYGKQGLAWLKRSDVTAKERSELLSELTEMLEQGRRNHPRDEPLRQLLVIVQNAKLGH